MGVLIVTSYKRENFKRKPAQWSVYRKKLNVDTDIVKIIKMMNGDVTQYTDRINIVPVHGIIYLK